MEINSENRSFVTELVLLDTVAEQLADVDLTLPDYCPDIEKILKCTLTPNIQTKSLSGGQLQIDGFCTVNVLYIEKERKTVRCCEQNVNFSQSFSVRDTPENYAVVTRTKPEYINCRALSPRRLVIRGAFSLYAKVIATDKTNIFMPSGDQLEVLKKSLRIADLKAFCQEQFTFSEEISAADKPAIESILYSKLSANITDSKAVSGKLMINGEINLCLFYLSGVESGETSKLDYILPFNQIIDCEGVDVNTINLISCEVMSYDLRLKNDMLSEKPAIAVDVKLCLTEEGYLSEETQIAVDAYSLDYASQPRFENLKTVSEAVPVSESFMEKLSVSVDSGKISKILDIFAEDVTLETVPENGSLKAGGRINLCMLALDENETPMFVERICEYSHVLASAEGCDSLIFPNARAAGISYRLSDDNAAEIRCELKISGGALKNEVNRALSGIEVFEDQPLEGDSCALTLYFARRGESLWEIAKAHKTRLSLLQAENAQDELATERAGMLLIPKI